MGGRAQLLREDSCARSGNEKNETTENANTIAADFFGIWTDAKFARNSLPAHTTAKLRGDILGCGVRSLMNRVLIFE